MSENKNKTIKNFGYLTEPIKIDEDYVFGGLSLLPKTILQENGDWTPYLPQEELQRIKIETQACTSFGTLNCVEIILNKLGTNKNFSDRWLAWNAGTDPLSGNTPQRVAETLRKTGVPFQPKWDFTSDIDTPEKFYINPPVKLFDDAKEDFNYEFGHEYVPTSEFSLRDALRYSPLGVSVSAWQSDGEFYVKPEGMRDNHWCVCYGFDNEKKAWRIFDSYDNSKKLYKGQFEVAKRYSVSLSTPKRTFLTRLKDLFVLIF